MRFLTFFSFCGIVFLSATISRNTLSAQILSSSSTVRFSFSAEYIQQIHDVRFLNLPLGVRETIDNGEPNTAYTLRYGLGTGFAASLGAEVPLLPFLSAGLSLRAVLPQATLFSDTLRTPAGRADGTETVLASQRRMDVILHTIGAELLFRANPLPEPFRGVNFYAGLRGDIFSRKDFYLREEMLPESDGAFENGLRTRREQRRELPEVRNLGIANFNAAALGGLGVEFDFGTNRVFSIEARVLADFGLLNVFQKMDAPGEFWRINSVRGGIALRYYSERENDLTEIEYRLKRLQDVERSIAVERTKIQEDLRELKQSGISAAILKVQGIDGNGREQERPILRIAEEQTLQSMAWLPVVYFNERSNVIPARYQRLSASAAERFSTEQTAKSAPLRAYYHVLNIVGKRLQTVPEATILLTTYLCDVGVERNNAGLGRERIRAIREYLRQTWSIAPERVLAAEERVSLPENASETLLAECRAVRISSANPEIIRPLEVGSLAKRVSPERLRVEIDIRAGVGIKEWVLEGSQFDGREIRTLKLSRGRNEYPSSITWEMNDDDSAVPIAGNPLSIKLDVTDLTNRNADVPPTEIEVVQEITEKQALKRFFSYTVPKDANFLALATVRASSTAPRSVALYFTDSQPSAETVANFALKLGIAPTSVRVLRDEKYGKEYFDMLRNETLPERSFYQGLLRLEIQS